MWLTKFLKHPALFVQTHTLLTLWNFSSKTTTIFFFGGKSKFSHNRCTVEFVHMFFSFLGFAVIAAGYINGERTSRQSRLLPEETRYSHSSASYCSLHFTGKTLHRKLPRYYKRWTFKLAVAKRWGQTAISIIIQRKDFNFEVSIRYSIKRSTFVVQK